MEEVVECEVVFEADSDLVGEDEEVVFELDLEEEDAPAVEELPAEVGVQRSYRRPRRNAAYCRPAPGPKRLRKAGS